ncbi:DUF6037 family protein [Bacillus cereus]
MNILGNFRDLKSDMIGKGWCIDSFVFKYNQQEYIVLVKLYMKDEKIPEFALLKLEFLKRNNITDKLITPANAVKLFNRCEDIENIFWYSFWN